MVARRSSQKHSRFFQIVFDMPATVDSSEFPHIVILGASYAGIAAYKSLKSCNSIRITVIDPRPSFYFNCAAPRAILDTVIASQSVIPYTNVPIKHAKVVRVDIEVKRIVLDSEEAISYDYLLVCTGNTFASPWHYSSSSFELLETNLNDIRQHISLARHVVVVGGGAVGIEVASEIAYHYQQLKRENASVTIVHSGSEVLSGMDVPHGDVFRENIMKKLRQFAVNVIFNDRLELSDEEKQRSFISEEKTWRLKSGRVLDADLILICTGSGKPQTSFLPNTLLRPSSHVNVDDTLRSKYDDRIFAAGDCASTPFPKMAYIASWQGTRAAQNMLLSMKYTRQNPNCSSVPSSVLKGFKGAGGMIFVMMGRKGGVGYVPGMGIVGDNIVWMMKSRDAMIGKAWHDLGLCRPGNIEIEDTEGISTQTSTQVGAMNRVLDLGLGLGNKIATWGVESFWYTNHQNKNPEEDDPTIWQSRSLVQ